jgi:hypothetical protein
MIDEALVDTDVLLKTVSYRLAHASLTHLAAHGMRPRVLGAARFMLAAHVKRGECIQDVGAAAAELALVEPLLDDIEPTAEETSFAAEFEALAAATGLAIDGGESQLVAMLMASGTRLMVTGDKRAVAGIASLLSIGPLRRVACLEQLIGSLVDALGAEVVRAAICCEPLVDIALAVACCCSSPPGTDPRPGLMSYIDDLRAKAPAVLCAGYRFPA